LMPPTTMIMISAKYQPHIKAIQPVHTEDIKPAGQGSPPPTLFR
jgi:hypothetical protein